MNKWFKSRLVSTRFFSFKPQLPRGEPLPQTVANLQQIMASDHVMIMQMKAEISRLKNQNQRLKDRLMRFKRKNNDE